MLYCPIGVSNVVLSVCLSVRWIDNIDSMDNLHSVTTERRGGATDPYITTAGKKGRREEGGDGGGRRGGRGWQLGVGGSGKRLRRFLNLVHHQHENISPCCQWRC